MKLKLVATIKKEALLPGMEQAVQDINLQKELNKPGVVQQVNMSDQTAKNQLMAEYRRGGDWNAGDLEKDIKSYMEKFHSGKPYGIGVAESNPLGDVSFQRENAIADGQAKAKNQNASGHIFFTDAAPNVYVLVY